MVISYQADGASAFLALRYVIVFWILEIERSFPTSFMVIPISGDTPQPVIASLSGMPTSYVNKICHRSF